MDESANKSSEAPKNSSSNMMVIIAIIVVLILLGGGYYMMNKNVQAPSSNTMMKAKNSTTSAPLFSSIQDALSKSLSLQCDYTDEQTGMKTVAYIKAGAIRTDMSGKTPTESGSAIIKDKKIYFWNGKEGFMMEFDPTQMAKEDGNMVKTAPSQKDKSANVMESLEKFREYCKPATIDDALFTPPSEITFQDFSKMMPSGIIVPSGMNQQQIEQMQKNIMENMSSSPNP